MAVGGKGIGDKEFDGFTGNVVFTGCRRGYLTKKENPSKTRYGSTNGFSDLCGTSL
jgi:hypothetical protein